MAKKNKNGLTQNQQVFADTYLEQSLPRSYSRAYLSAYSKTCKSVKVAEANASRLLTNDKVFGYIEQALEKASNSAVVTAERILKEETRLAYSDLRKLFKNGTTIPPEDLPDDVALALSGVEIVERIISSDNEEKVVERKYKYRFWDKGQALNRLEKHLGMFKIHNDQKRDNLLLMPLGLDMTDMTDTELAFLEKIGMKLHGISNGNSDNSD